MKLENEVSKISDIIGVGQENNHERIVFFLRGVQNFIDHGEPNIYGHHNIGQWWVATGLP